MFSEIDDVLLQIRVGVWMGDLSDAAYDHESTGAFEAAIRNDVATFLDLSKMDQSLAGTLEALWVAKGGYWDRQHEDELRNRINYALGRASLPGNTVGIHRPNPPAVPKPLAGTCYPSDDGGWIRTRIYLLSKNQAQWTADNAVTQYLRAGQNPAKQVETELRGIALAVIAVFSHHHHDT